jgi:hypothetical protein
MLVWNSTLIRYANSKLSFAKVGKFRGADYYLLNKHLDCKSMLTQG